MIKSLTNSVKAWQFCQAFLLLSLLYLGGCQSVEHRLQKTDSLLRDLGYHKQILDTSPFKLYAAYPEQEQKSTGPFQIVIEGDGFSWLDIRTPSDDPTPLDPAGLRLAGNLGALYLARPCQYARSPQCAPLFWTDKRFDRSVIDSYHQALNLLKARNNHNSFHLHGYSGGAYIALVLAAERDDITKVTTVAGLLDPPEWTAYHEVTPLLQPSPFSALLQASRDVSFHHYCGEQDEIIPCGLTYKAVRQAENLGIHNHRISPVSQADHNSIIQKLSQ